jgi:DNA-binding transcriptional MerR regulator
MTRNVDVPEPGEQGGSGALRYRAGDLAAEVGISIQLLRSYQSKGLLPPPRHEGRVAWYGPHHRERLVHIRHLKDRGFSLRMIAETLDEGPEAPLALVEEREVLRLAEVAERSGVPVEVLRALEASGLLRPHHLEDGDRYSDADVRFVRNVLTLLGVGLSLEDLMRIARQQLETSDALGRDVMVAWSQLVGTRLRRTRSGSRGHGPAGDGPAGDGPTPGGPGSDGSGADGPRAGGSGTGGDDSDGDHASDGAAHEAEHAARVAASIRALAAIVGQLVAYRVERAVLDAARSEIEAEGTDAERRALARSLGAPLAGP